MLLELLEEFLQPYYLHLNERTAFNGASRRCFCFQQHLQSPNYNLHELSRSDIALQWLWLLPGNVIKRLRIWNKSLKSDAALRHQTDFICGGTDGQLSKVSLWWRLKRSVCLISLPAGRSWKTTYSRSSQRSFFQPSHQPLINLCFTYRLARPLEKRRLIIALFLPVRTSDDLTAHVLFPVTSADKQRGERFTESGRQLTAGPPLGAPACL